MIRQILTPTDVNVISLVKNPITGIITFPVLSFNSSLINPFFTDMNPLNKDERYHKRMIKYFYTKLTEKWLYRSQDYKKLLKYFKIEKSGDNSKVRIIDSLDKISKDSIEKKDRKFIYRYIEKIFINKRFVRKVLQQYIAKTKINWYDLVSNSDTLKELFAHKLAKLIKNAIEDIND